MTFVSSVEKPSHKKCHKQSKREKNSLFKLTMASILRKAEGNLGKTNLLKQTIYWSTNIHILQSPKKPSTIIGYQSVGHPELEPKTKSPWLNPYKEM